jgi:hypothetical protein
MEPNGKILLLSSNLRMRDEEKLVNRNGSLTAMH